ncbi:hypothetical protein ACWEQJ_34820, partial [Streptomyces cyaneofuscatus]
MTSATPTTDSRFDLVVLDMAGTTVADGGLVEQAFSAAAERLGVRPGSGDHEHQLAYVRATMGESKISVFRHPDDHHVYNVNADTAAAALAAAL